MMDLPPIAYIPGTVLFGKKCQMSQNITIKSFKLKHPKDISLMFKFTSTYEFKIYVIRI